MKVTPLLLELPMIVSVMMVAVMMTALMLGRSVGKQKAEKELRWFKSQQWLQDGRPLK